MEKHEQAFQRLKAQLMWVNFRIAHFIGCSLFKIFYLEIMVRTLRRFPLDTNLTKWLSKCEGSLQKGKEKM